ncbi:hypothetical protein [Streptomyces werraensis]|uniref:hypothetical protein n=1 Tax=Streptomyces werraensis TaxID=68284 RepID=UPI0037F66C9D
MQKRANHLLPTEAATALASTSGTADEAEAAIGIRVSNGRVVEANGNDFVMRGVNHPHAWYTAHPVRHGSAGRSDRLPRRH